MISIDLSSKKALVTGTTGQLGGVIARTLARAGADVALHYHAAANKAAALQADIEKMGGRAVTVQADVGERDSVFAMRDKVIADFGAPDIIVTNAVQQYEWTTLLEQDAADYESQFRTCTMQNVLMAKAFVPGMIERAWGRVIAINTECLMQCDPRMSAYISGKAGQDRVLRVLAKEVGGHNITVNQVAPGWTISERDRENGTERQPDYDKHVPLGHRGTDQDIANAVAFVASDLAAFITGAYIPVCGGNVMPCV